MKCPPKTNRYVVAALYQFISLDDPASWQNRLKEICQHCQLMGTLLVAPEGLNGTVAGQHSDIKKFTDWLENKTPFKGLKLNSPYMMSLPFTA